MDFLQVFLVVNVKDVFWLIDRFSKKIKKYLVRINVFLDSEGQNEQLSTSRQNSINTDKLLNNGTKISQFVTYKNIFR